MGKNIYVRISNLNKIIDTSDPHYFHFKHSLINIISKNVNLIATCSKMTEFTKQSSPLLEWKKSLIFRIKLYHQM